MKTHVTVSGRQLRPAASAFSSTKSRSLSETILPVEVGHVVGT
jgi:hypothetical protein